MKVNAFEMRRIIYRSLLHEASSTWFMILCNTPTNLSVFCCRSKRALIFRQGRGISQVRSRLRPGSTTKVLKSCVWYHTTRARKQQALTICVLGLCGFWMLFSLQEICCYYIYFHLFPKYPQVFVLWLLSLTEALASKTKSLWKLADIYKSQNGSSYKASLNPHTACNGDVAHAACRYTSTFTLTRLFTISVLMYLCTWTFQARSFENLLTKLCNWSFLSQCYSSMIATWRIRYCVIFKPEALSCGS